MAEFFTVGAYYAVSLVMIEVDLSVAIAQLLKYWCSGSRSDVTPQAQAQYARLYSSTSVSAILTAVLVVLGVIASRFGARLRMTLPKEPVAVDPRATNKPPVPVEERPPTPPVPEPRRFGLPSEGYSTPVNTPPALSAVSRVPDQRSSAPQYAVAVLIWRSGLVDFLADVWDTIGPAEFELDECTKVIDELLTPAVLLGILACPDCMRTFTDSRDLSAHTIDCPIRRRRLEEG